MKMRLFVVSILLLFGFPFIVTKVVDSFGTCNEFFLKGQPPTIKDILENSVSKNNNQYKIICQKYKNAYKFANFYDITKKIPVFSAYKYTGSATGGPHLSSWMIEPQLETLGDEMREPCVNQASPGDYWVQKGFIHKLERGHLFPNAHAADKDTAESTFTMTNIVPQYETFNSGSWLKMEENVRAYMDSHCRDKDNAANTLAYVLTGAVPSRSALLNKRVNVPSHMWTAFCCYNSESKKWESQAHWAENKDESKEKDKTISKKTLEKLQEFLKKKYNKEYKLFINDCLGN
ncbi:Endonuclease domain-containing 1 protein [Anabarilius grahami]|uniref:Endonuclease domain-containing 1 protein n=1 Tax=Anabarilius grahami TaxID=495550 RepID=A0A3N0YJ86_ANAGA|nr:Endonuclease domain-containing 1 protein [Anabarilius grahami]